MRDLVIIEAEGKLRHFYQIFAEIGYKADLFATLGFFLDNPKSFKDTAVRLRSGEFIEPFREPVRPDAYLRLKHTIQSCSGRIVIATDNDHEGHVIASDIAELVKQINPKAPIFRALFTALDKNSVAQALTHLTALDPTLAYPGTARRITDRIIGHHYSDFNHFRPVGRIQSALLGLAHDEQYVLSIKPMSVPAADGRAPFVAPVPIRTGQTPADLIAQLNDSKLETASMAMMPISTPLNGGEALLLLSKGLDLSVRTAAGLLQSMYEAGEISYHRTMGTGYSEEGKQVIANLAQIRGVLGFKRSSLPSMGSNDNHEALRVLDLDKLNKIDINKPVVLQPNERSAALALIAQRNIQSGLMVRRDIPNITSLPEWAKKLDWKREYRIAMPWKKTEITGDLSAEQTVLFALTEHELGRPSTYPGHVDRFIERGLVDNQFKLTERGQNWLQAAPDSLRDALTSFKIEALLNDGGDDVRSLVIDALSLVAEGRNDELEHILEQLEEMDLPEPENVARLHL